MRTAYLISSYLHFNFLTSPTPEWLNSQLDAHGIDSSKYNDWSANKLIILSAYTAGIIICELFYSHRFYVSQTAEETKYPFKPHRCMFTFAVMLGLIWTYPYNRFIHFLFLCSIQRIVINHLAILQVKTQSPRGMMYLVIPYWFGTVFRIFIFWYIMYWTLLLIYSLFIKAIQEIDLIKFINWLAYIVSGGLYYVAISTGNENLLLSSLVVFMVMNFLFIRSYYDFMGPHLKENEKIWKNRGYNLW